MPPFSFFSNKKKKSIWHSSKIALLFILPGFLLYFFWFIYPLGYTFGLSLTNQTFYNLITGAKFIGLDNFGKLFSQASMLWPVLIVTFEWVALSVSFKVIFGLAFASLYNSERVKGKGILLPLMIVPWVIPGILSILTWRSMFLTEFGVINKILHVVGLPGVNWLGVPMNALFAYVIVETWLAYPFMMTVILGALKNIPTEIQESAVMDNATGLRKLRHITLPLIRKPLAYATIMTTNTSFQMLGVPYLLNQGGPARANEILMVYGYREAFSYANYAYASAFVIFATVIILLFGLLVLKASKLMEE